MTDSTLIPTRVAHYYRVDNLSCTTTTLKILSEIYDVEISQQVFDAALGLHGAGKYGAQCGLVEGGLMFITIFGRELGLPDERSVLTCNQFAQDFEQQFKSLICRELRPQGFSPKLPPHLCEKLTCEAIEFTAKFVQELFEPADLTCK
ncbi:C-GCAxxG-C-C family protein [Desulfopila aestuarii]|uniref:Putative redox-active protein (C_GCAxxG_C_C) n=1 Tax=Desulfopila aestuarii DSM 18488 TaxID=1121416 RepID=A0A1M7XWR1_9BACT|nr:C-GCAxxG-C-C family protein [Desulfopila aestuarii]SHO43199.1 Putative redox-active protein (C_GCAxxG_C_C) [Desulfopila aestuarii DSM 18488]